MLSSESLNRLKDLFRELFLLETADLEEEYPLIRQGDSYIPRLFAGPK